MFKILGNQKLILLLNLILGGIKTALLYLVAHHSRNFSNTNFENSEFGNKNRNDSSSFSLDGGFGVAGGIEDTTEDEVNQKMTPIAALPISVSIPSPPPRRHSLRVSKNRGSFSLNTKLL